MRNITKNKTKNRTKNRVTKIMKLHKAMQKIMQTIHTDAFVSHIGDLKKLVTFSQLKTCGESGALANFVIFAHFQLRRIPL